MCLLPPEIEQICIQTSSPKFKRKILNRDFPGSPVAKTPPTPSAEGPGWIPGQGTRSHIPQLKVPRATTKTRSTQRSKYIF